MRLVSRYACMRWCKVYQEGVRMPVSCYGARLHNAFALALVYIFCDVCSDFVMRAAARNGGRIHQRFMVQGAC